MQTFEELDNEEIGMLLHQWFPQHMPGLLSYFEDMALAMTEEPANRQPEIAGVSKGELSEIWLEIASRIQLEPELKDNPAHFAARMFSGKIGLVNVNCIVTWINFIQHPNPKFTKAVKFLFEKSI